MATIARITKRHQRRSEREHPAENDPDQQELNHHPNCGDRELPVQPKAVNHRDHTIEANQNRGDGEILRIENDRGFHARFSVPARMTKC
jgi:hypothetical protein